MGLSDLQDNFVDGNYNVDLNANWRLKLLEAFKEYFYTEDEAGNKTYDYDLIFDRIENADELSDSEYQALLDTLSEFGIVIGTNEDRGNLKDKVYEYLRGEITNTDGSLVACPYKALTYEERSLYVRYAEDLNPDWEDKMSGIYETFEADNYPGWEASTSVTI